MAVRKRNNPRVFNRKDNRPTSRLKTLGAEEATNESTSRDERVESTKFANEIDRKMGFERYEGGKKQRDEDKGGQISAVDFYFLDEDGGGFKATLQYNPYFLIACKSGMEAEVEEYLRRRYEDLIVKVVRVSKEDLRMPNHLLGYRRTFLQLQFQNVPDLLTVRRAILPIADANRKKMDAMDAYTEVVQSSFQFEDDIEESAGSRQVQDAIENIIDAREWDVPYHIRVAIDKDIRIGKWYTVKAKAGQITIEVIEDRLKRADPVVLAFDIETAKSPLKFPDATIDSIMMISYMIDGQGFLITNREIVSSDIDDFDYTPKPEFEGPFTIINASDERAMLVHFFEHIQSARPTIIATYNGDFFDWPFVEQRAAIAGINMYDEIGFKQDDEGEYKSRYCAHMDCLKWVKRDSYLPQGSQGLKAVTTAKLGYDPIELDPEVMTKFAYEQPQTLAQYSVSDAVATYYLYMKYIHPFIFSLCNIIPLNPDDVLRKGSGTLCETLLMVQAYKKGIVLPNKHVDPAEKHYDGHLLESETYVGGHVEALEAGVFRSDIPLKFGIDTTAIDELLHDLDSALKFSIEVEGRKKLEDVENYDEVKAAVAACLQQLKDNPSRMERPKIYHLDVSAMYPNIMITNRLQPDSMIDESVCASCDFNRPGKTCDRRLPWSWRGEFFPAKRDEYNMLRRALSNEMFPGKYPSSPLRRFDELSATEQATHIQKRLSDYCRKVYHKIHETEVVEKEAIICQRENPFYIDTVKSFRDRRYEYKGHHKTWKKNVEQATGVSAVEEAKAMVILYDSLQLAHKVILNSFYGYVMRKGSRWYSMEMAGVTCLTGASLIQMARQLVERIGRPLELDTDGIWCVLPETFPENFTFKLRGGKTLWLSYPCAMLNHLVHARYTNDQYAELVDPVTLKYKTSSENSIFFEIDGPYRAMILPASKEEDKNLKKRYAVFNDNGSLAELKGFEVKRRGELKLIKIFQTQIFKVFLEGTTLEECYSAVAKVANRWLDVLFSKGRTLADEELLELISENRSMSKVLEEYGSQKSTSITTAKRLAEFLGDQMVKDRGLACKYIISSMPKGAPVTERAVPVAIFSAEPTLKRHFLKLWLKDNSLGDLDLRSILDWDYYIERLGGVVQKLITIPAAMQQVENPVPKVAHPDWLRRRVNAANDKMKQRKVTDMFQKVSPPKLTDVTNLSTPSTYGAKSMIPAKRKELHSPGSKENDPLGAIPDELAPSTDDYASWLAYQKRKWRTQRQSRIRRRKILGLGDKGVSNGLGGYFRHQSEPLFTQKWEIIQLRETDIPGQLKAFVMIDSKIVSVKVNPVRKIYVNFKNSDLPNVDIESCSIQKVFKLLPNGSPSVNLFEISMPEHIYGSNIAKFRSIFNHPSVEGIYERQIPLKTRTLLDLGTACHVQVQNGGDISQAIDLGFDVTHLRKLEEQTSYLHNTKFQYLYIYKVTNGRRHIFGLFSSVRTEAMVMVVDPSRDAPDIPNLAKLYGEQLTAQRARGDAGSLVFEYTDHINFDSSKVRSEKVYSLLAKAIQKLQAERKAPTIVILDSKDSESLMKHLPVLRDYPILTYPSSDKEMALPAVGWLQAASKRMISHFLRLSGWISHRIGLARYGNVPLCDIGEDETKFLTDILFARRLVEQNVVLWWSPTPYPDLGGRANEDPFLTLQDIETPEFNTPGCYTTVCIELEIRNLPINTILTSALINELEGVDAQIDNNPGNTAFGDDESGAVALSDNAFSSAAVSVLKSMVKHWWDEASIGNGIADLMVLHLLRWIQSSDACMYDRALHRHIEIITKKALLQLMGEFKKMGSKAIYASPTKIMLLTTKSSVGVAYAYANYVVKAVKSKPLFSFLDISIQEYWDYLLWMDHVNYGGKACTEIESSEEQKLDTVLNWHIKSFLPIALQQEFQRWVIEFIDKMHEAKDPDNALRIPTQHRAAEPFSSPEHKRSNDEDEPLGIIDQHFAKPLISRVKYLIRKQGEAESRGDNELLETFAFPDVPGSTSRRNPTLQFVKYLCAIFSLSKEHHLEARMLRRDLLSILDIAEFSKDGIFTDPSESFKLSEVVCSHCGTARDLDFCKDADLLPDEEVDHAIAWRCIQCHHEYSQLALQERMVVQMQSLITAYQLQDLKCARCKQVRGDELSDHCACSGEWIGSIGMMEMRKRLGVFKSVAEFYRLDMLRGAVDEVFMLADM